MLTVRNADAARFLVALASIVILGAIASSADAAVVTIGSPLGGAVSQFKTGPKTFVNRTLGEPGAKVTSPVSGLIVRWRVLDAEGGPFRLRVVSPGPGGAYKGVSTGGPETPTDAALQVFPASIPIEAGQTIGLDNPGSGDKLGEILNVTSSFGRWVPPLADGQTLSPTEVVAGGEVAFNADVQPAPTVTLLSPASGSIGGGTVVSIAGADFTGVKAVDFGNVPASSYSVGSEGLISAVAPKVGGPGQVEVTVTTVAGRSPLTAADDFAYEACIVPRLKHKRLKAVRKALRKAQCKLGKVKREAGAGKAARVIKQGIKPGDKRPPGTRVGVRLGSN